ncbi:MAG TPA: hypothetical protein VG222_01925 [Vicinamibacterales bacterium]|nr:hypothetical protein [Vicinamibacterales bacterium]
MKDGIDRCHWTKEQVDPLLHLANRAAGATMGWIKYLMSTPTPLSHWQGK